jgi:ribose transport system substrate-binding protein
VQVTVRSIFGVIRRGGLLGVSLLAIAACLALVACGNSDGDGSSTAAENGSSDNAERQLLFLELPFPCDLNEFAVDLCEGAEDAGEKLPPGFELQLRTGIDYADVPAFNSQIQNSLQLDPAGMVVFPNGEAAQVPVLNQACEMGVAVVFVDNEPTSGVPCRASLVTQPNAKLGEEAAKYLIAHPPASGSKQVAIVSQQPGSFKSNDERVDGFTKIAEDAGYEVVTTIITTNDLEQTRGLVTNALTAHPDLGAIYSANGPMGAGVSQALNGKEGIVHVTLDGNVEEVENILDGTADANVAYTAYELGELSIEKLADVVQGEEVPSEIMTSKVVVVDEANAQEYIDAGGFRGYVEAGGAEK